MTTTAWYILPSRYIWARWLNILHLPYTGWHLSYPVLGAALASELNGPVLGWTVLAFFFGMGIAAHAFDLAHNDPLRLGLRWGHLVGVGSVTLLVACGIGVWQVWIGNVPVLMTLAVPAGIILAAGYNFEVPGFHGDWQFAAWWAVFPLMVGYFAQGMEWTPALVPLLLFAFFTATAQRVLSTRARYLRRQVQGAAVSLQNHWDEGSGQWLWGAQGFKPWILAPLDQGLMWLSLAMPVLAAMVVLWRHF